MPRKRLTSLSSAETEILRLVWKLGQATVRDVCEQLPRKRRIGYATVQTLLRRLEAKGYVGHEARGKAHVFRPAVRPQEVITKTVRDFVDRLFGGDPVPLMLHLAEESELDEESVEQLRRLLGPDKS